MKLDVPLSPHCLWLRPYHPPLDSCYVKEEEKEPLKAPGQRHRSCRWCTPHYRIWEIVSWHREKKEVAKKVNSKKREDRGVSMLLDRLLKGVRHGHQDWPLGGKLEGRIVPDSTTRTNVSEFKPAQSPLHFSSFSRPSSSRRSGIQKPARNSRCSESIIWVNLSSSALGGLPFRLCAFKLASSSSSRCM
jgi:hypothetical protein